MEKMMTRKEFAEYLNVSIDGIDNLRSDGMPWIQVRTRVRIPVDQAVAWMRERAIKGDGKQNKAVNPSLNGSNYGRTRQIR